jgi:putative nucleotidyltransferase with HDIG domain
MRKVFIGLEECTSGMQIAETIYNEYGAIIVAEYTLLDDHIINKIKNLGLYRIKIYEQEDNVISANSSELFKAQYKENVDIVKDMLHDISSGKSIDINKVSAVSDSIVVRINENRDIVSCINQIRSVDEYTYTHSINVSLLCMLIGKWLRFDLEKIKRIIHAGLLHDMGKSMISAEILNKPGVLSHEEYEEMKKHPVYGFRIVENLSELDNEVKKAILMHHERNDGSGYPFGLKGEGINEYAKAIAVADIYDAMTSNRAYKIKESPFKVFEHMEKSTFGVLDSRMVNAFLHNIAAYYIGDIVKLTNGTIGEIVYINPRHISLPLVRVGNNYIDLSMESGIRIQELL